MSILITGGAGFIGSHLANFLLKTTEEKIIILDRLDPTSTLQRFENPPLNRLEFIWWDLKAEFNTSIKRKLRDVNFVIHTAASSHVDRSIQNPLLFTMDNVVGTCNLLNWVRNHNIGLIHCSTDEVFSDAIDNYAFKETDPLTPSNPYAATKMGAEGLVQAFSCTYDINALIIRLTNVIGTKQHPEKFIPKAIKQILSGQEVVIHSDLEEMHSGTRYYIDIRDVCAAFQLLMTQENIPVLNKKNRHEGIYHVSGDTEISNIYIVEKIAKLLNKGLKCRFKSYDSTRPYHDMSYRIDDSRIRLLGWTTKYNIDESLTDIVNWYQNNPEWLDI